MASASPVSRRGARGVSSESASHKNKRGPTLQESALSFYMRYKLACIIAEMQLSLPCYCVKILNYSLESARATDCIANMTEKPKPSLYFLPLSITLIVSVPSKGVPSISSPDTVTSNAFPALDMLCTSDLSNFTIRSGTPSLS